MGDWRKNLVVLDFAPSNLTETELERVMRCNWYEADYNGYRVLLVPFVACGQLTETDPIDAGINLWHKDVVIRRVADSLKRFSIEDGFYHA